MIAAIENAMLARLKAASDAAVLGYRFRTLDSYPEAFDAYLNEKVLGDRAFPAAWAVFGGWPTPEDIGTSVQADAVFMIVVAAQNLRNETSQRHGATASEVGSYQLATDVAALLHGQTLGLDIGRLKVGACRSIRPTETITKRKLSLYAVEFRTAMPIEVSNFSRPDPTDFTTFHANWDVPPFAGITEIPADDTADATDHITLEPAS